MSENKQGTWNLWDLYSGMGLSTVKRDLCRLTELVMLQEHTRGRIRYGLI